LHLPAREKPMDIFGPHWHNHFERICEDWHAKVSPQDIVLLPGDLTWAMHLEEAQEDLDRLADLPGTKLLIRGNHDYWWSSIGRVRRALPDGCFALQNDSMEIEGILFAGSRGWTIPGDPEGDSDDARIYRRERQRLEMSLNNARIKNPDAPLIVMMHYPPRSDMDPGFADILEKFRASHVVYGHLHGAGLAGAIQGDLNGILYHQVSCDGLDFKLARIWN
jgi:predicted phosphohydrolase